MLDNHEYDPDCKYCCDIVQKNIEDEIKDYMKIKYGGI